MYSYIHLYIAFCTHLQLRHQLIGALQLGYSRFHTPQVTAERLSLLLQTLHVESNQVQIALRRVVHFSFQHLFELRRLVLYRLVNFLTHNGYPLSNVLGGKGELCQDFARY